MAGMCDSLFSRTSLNLKDQITAWLACSGNDPIQPTWGWGLDARAVPRLTSVRESQCAHCLGDMREFAGVLNVAREDAICSGLCTYQPGLSSGGRLGWSRWHPRALATATC
jgi:hypothetical protein